MNLRWSCCLAPAQAKVSVFSLCLDISKQTFYRFWGLNLWLAWTDDEEEVLESESSEMDEYVSPEQLDEQLVTLSLLPDSRWKNLLHLDIIKVCTKEFLPWLFGLDSFVPINTQRCHHRKETSLKNHLKCPKQPLFSSPPFLDSSLSLLFLIRHWKNR